MLSKSVNPSSITATTPYLELYVGPYRLALPTTNVISVVDDVDLTGSLQYRDQTVPLLDLAALLIRCPARVQAPYGVIFAADCSAAVAVDAVGHLRAGCSLDSVPKLGLLVPELYRGALRRDDGLLLVFEAAPLAELVYTHR